MTPEVIDEFEIIEHVAGRFEKGKFKMISLVGVPIVYWDCQKQHVEQSHRLSKVFTGVRDEDSLAEAQKYRSLLENFLTQKREEFDIVEAIRLAEHKFKTYGDITLK